MLFTKLIALLPLAICMSVLRVLASPAGMQERDSMDNRWNAIYKQVGKNGVQQLCQAILPHATTTKTGPYGYLVFVSFLLILHGHV